MLANVVSREQSVKGVVSKVVLGEADAGIVYVSDVTMAVAGKVHSIPPSRIRPCPTQSRRWRGRRSLKSPHSSWTSCGLRKGKKSCEPTVSFVPTPDDPPMARCRGTARERSRLFHVGQASRRPAEAPAGPPGAARRDHGDGRPNGACCSACRCSRSSSSRSWRSSYASTRPQLLASLRTTEATQALRLSLRTTAISTLLAIVLGTPLALLLARPNVRFGRLLETLLELPILIPPSVAGIALLMAFGRRGIIGGWLDGLGLQLVFTPAAVVLAQLFVAAPFYVKAAVLGFASMDEEAQEAAAIDGANAWQRFWLVLVPLAWPALLSGAVTTWARALGEFGRHHTFSPATSRAVPRRCRWPSSSGSRSISTWPSPFPSS